MIKTMAFTRGVDESLDDFIARIIAGFEAILPGAAHALTMGLDLVPPPTTMPGETFVMKVRCSATKAFEAVNLIEENDLGEVSE